MTHELEVVESEPPSRFGSCTFLILFPSYFLSQINSILLLFFPTPYFPGLKTRAKAYGIFQRWKCFLNWIVGEKIPCQILLPEDLYRLEEWSIQNGPAGVCQPWTPGIHSGIVNPFYIFLAPCSGRKCCCCLLRLWFGICESSGYLSVC